MIVDHSDGIDPFASLSAPLIAKQPHLQILGALLDDAELLALVRSDFVRRYPKSAVAGRHSTPLEIVLRMLVVRRLYDWTYQETVTWVEDSLCLRHLCRLKGHTAPDASTLDRWAQCLQPTTLVTMEERVIELARQRGVTQGRKLRVDSTVVPTTIHHPSDSTLLADGVRVISRLLRRAKHLLPELDPRL